MKILVIYNKKAAGQLAALKQAFSANRHSVVFKPLSRALRKHVKQAAEQGCKCVVAAGGDGTVNAVTNEVMRHEHLKLGVVPMGTLNHFAKDIGLPADLQVAVRAIVNSYTRKVDVAKVNDHYFLNNASFGFYPALVRHREQSEKSIGKWPALLWAFVKVMPRLRRYHVRISYNGTQKTYRTPFVLISNNAYDIHAQNFTKRKTLTGGTLAVYILKTGSLQELLLTSWRAMKGDLKQARTFTTIKTDEVTLERISGKRMLLAYDGEVVAWPHASASFTILPQKLKVIAIKNEDREREN